MPETAPAVRTWPRPLMVGLLAIYVVADLALWLLGFYHLMLVGTIEDVEERHLIEEHLTVAGEFLTLALVVMLVGGWAWRWAVASGRIGGRPTARFA